MESGGKRTKGNDELDLKMCERIHTMQARHLRVSRKIIRIKTKSTPP